MLLPDGRGRLHVWGGAGARVGANGECGHWLNCGGRWHGGDLKVALPRSGGAAVLDRRSEEARHAWGLPRCCGRGRPRAGDEGGVGKGLSRGDHDGDAT